ncbi:hypothetical protein BC941DRAFT_429670 [Chlamydoabsidia padenii]|nr:hypothetical protein BC941DRAFT_429670 [Chlamydoabsidia padenii]
MTHNPLTASQRFITYVLSLFDIQTPSPQQEQQYESTGLLSPTYSSSSNYFMTNSMVLVQRQVDYKYTYSPWSLGIWFKGLSKYKLYQMIMNLQPLRYTSSTTIPHTDDIPSDNTMISPVNQLLSIQQQTHEIVHQLDHLRPSDQFAQADSITRSLHPLVRLSTDTLPWPFSLLALLTIVQELLNISTSAQLRRHVFYRCKWGRWIILEMATLLKTASLDITIESTTTNQLLWDRLNHPLQEQQHWILAWLELTCTSMAKYDHHWKFKQEYQDVIEMAKELF